MTAVKQPLAAPEVADGPREIRGRGFSPLYTNACVVHGCETNSALVKVFADLDYRSDDGAADPVCIDLSGNYLPDRSLTAVVHVISTIPKLEALNLRNTRLEAPGLNAVCEMAAVHPALHTLDVSMNPLFASSGRRLAMLVKRNPRIHTLVFDHGGMPARIVREIEEPLGRNVARAFPLQPGSTYGVGTIFGSHGERSAEEAVAWKRGDSGAVDAIIAAEAPGVFSGTEPPVAAKTPFQERVLAEAALHEAPLLDAYRKCGSFAAQFFVDFGGRCDADAETAVNVAAAASTLEVLGREIVPALDAALTGLAFATTSPADVVVPKLRAELQALRRWCDCVDVASTDDESEEAATARLLADEIDSSLASLAARLSSDRVTDTEKAAALDDAEALTQHARGVAAGLVNEAVDSELRALRQAVVERHLHRGTRKLVLLQAQASYFLDDYSPRMARECAARYRACQPPIRSSLRAMQRDLLAAAAPEYAESRRAMLAEWRSLVPAPLFRFALQGLVGACLDHCTGTRALHSLAFTGEITADPGADFPVDAAKARGVGQLPLPAANSVEAWDPLTRLAHDYAGEREARQLLLRFGVQRRLEDALRRAAAAPVCDTNREE